MATGREIAHKIGGKRDEIQKKARIVTSQIAALEQELNVIVQDQSRLLQQLAAIHLKQDIGLPKNIDVMLKKRDIRIQEASETITAAEAKLTDLLERRESLAEAFEADYRAYEAANEQADNLYQEDEDVFRIRGDLQNAVDTLDQLEGKLDRAVAELNEKRVAYEEDQHFMYLIRNKFGMQEYNGFGLIARGDRWLAKLIAFDRKKRDYDTLQAIPDWIQQRIEKMTETHNDIAKELEIIYQRTHEDVFPLKEKAEESDAALKELDAEIFSFREKIREASEYISEAADATDEDLFRITKTYAEQMAKLGISDLHALAKKTESDEDDVLVAKISALDARHESIRTQILSLTPGKLEFEKRLKNLDEIETKLRRRGWSGSSDRFSSTVDDSTINGLVAGLISAASFWDTLQRAHRPPENLYPTIRSSTNSGWSSRTSSRSRSSGGGFGGGSKWKSGGGFGGGGSSTGGGF